VKSLQGRRILVTRPGGQGEALAALIRAAGGEALCIPAIEIQDLAEPKGFFAVADTLSTFDLAIFVSPNAVQRGLKRLRARGVQVPWAGRPRVAALGQGSRRALEKEGFRDVIAPAGLPDSEALLALPELGKVEGQRVALFRGEGGRDLLGSELATRGAQVASAECYRRLLPESSRAPLGEALARGIDALAVTSSEGLANLLALAGPAGASRLAQVPVFVPHPRIVATASRHGLQRAIIAGAGDAETAAALVAYFAAAG
jgi:uroporphyrinogen-III synthase